MELARIGIVSPGDMGQAIAARLKEGGREVFTALEGRSERTRALAREAGIADCGTFERLVETCDMVLSVLNPAAALETARAVAAAAAAARRAIAFVDCNAVAPRTVREMEALVRAAGCVFIDAGIVGPPPRGQAKTRIYVSGPDAYLFARLEQPSIAVRVVSERAGDASAVKMCYGALTKGAAALGVELLVAARRLGVEQALEAELKESLGPIYAWLLGRYPPMPPKAYRWVPEMLEIAKTFEDAGMTPRIMEGAADIYAMIGETPIARETPEQARAHARSGKQVIEEIADARR